MHYMAVGMVVVVIIILFITSSAAKFIRLVILHYYLGTVFIVCNPMLMNNVLAGV